MQLEMFATAATPKPLHAPQVAPARTSLPMPTAQLAVASASTDLERLVKAFLVAGIDNPNTRAAYRCHLERALGMFQARRLNELTIGDLLAFRLAVMDSALSPSWRAVSLFALRAFLRWADELVGLPFSMEAARRALKAQKTVTLAPPAILSKEEARRVLQLAPRENGMHAMVSLLLGAGLRVAELCRLDCSDVVLAMDGPAIRVHGKRNKVRFVPIHEDTHLAITKYLEGPSRKGQGNKALFLAHDAGARGRTEQRIGKRSARRRVSKLLSAAGISKPVRVHGFRHTFATEAVRAGASPFHLKELLGHASIETTVRYVGHLELTELRAYLPQPANERQSRATGDGVQS